MTIDLTPYKNCLAHKHGLYISNEVKPYKPCCWFKGGVDAASFDEYQEKLSNLDIKNGCQHCIKQEQGGATWTHRNLFNKPTELVLGVCFDNICNIKCITCGPEHSSQHIGEWSKLGKFEKYKLDKKRFTKMMVDGPEKLKMVESTILSNQFDTLRLEIFGGEPLINPVVINFIKWLTEQGYAPKTNLVITTNGTTSLSIIADCIKDFNQVTIQFSVDGTNGTFDTMRFGANFLTTEKHAFELQELAKSHTNIRYGFHYTLSWLNADGFIDFYNWVANNFCDAQSLHLTSITGPGIYIVELIPYSMVQELLAAVDNLKIPQDNQGCLQEEFTRLISLYKQSIEHIQEPDLDTFLKNKATVKEALVELERLFSMREISLDSLPMVQRIRDYFNNTLPPYPPEHVIDTYCSGIDLWGNVATGNGTTVKKLLEKDSYHCGWRPPPEPRGHLYQVFCKGVDQWGQYADGEGGFYEIMISENCIDCGFEYPKLERGFLIRNFCKEFDQWGEYADGVGGKYEALIQENSMGCGFEYPVLERGFLVEVFCKGYEQWNRYADGAGGTYEELVEENSYGCGFRHPALARGFLVEVFCKGDDEWGKYADGNDGFYEELRFENSMYCLMKNKQQQQQQE
jgi:sulfatase maturation enzyme AslB (radical SAM superfamily)